jgi:hypothetical protein
VTFTQFVSVYNSICMCISMLFFTAYFFLRLKINYMIELWRVHLFSSWAWSRTDNMGLKICDTMIFAWKLWYLCYSNLSKVGTVQIAVRQAEVSICWRKCKLLVPDPVKLESRCRLSRAHDWPGVLGIWNGEGEVSLRATCGQGGWDRTTQKEGFQVSKREWKGS